MTEAQKIIEMIKQRVVTYNDNCHGVAESERNRYFHVTFGLLLALKNIKDDNNTYVLAFEDDFELHMQFGYYDDNGYWYVLEG